ncbi:MAG: hypothetical protein F6K04_02335 [Leptolyngbya sp. SIO4C5]|nr:hypothetical protein [Leptolyngbya sp. SIO4C5]
MPAKEPKSDLQRQLDRIERSGELHSVRMDAIDQNLKRASELIEAIATQIANLSEQITRFENATVERMEAFDKRMEALDKRLDYLANLTERQSATAERQAATAENLTRIVSMLVEQRVTS